MRCKLRRTELDKVRFIYDATGQCKQNTLCCTILYPDARLAARDTPRLSISICSSSVLPRPVIRLGLTRFLATFHQASSIRLPRRHSLGQRSLHALEGVKSYQSLVPRLCRLWRFGAKPICKHKSGDVSLGSLTSFPIKVRPRTVRHELEVSAQELRSSPSPNIAVSLLPSRSQDLRYLSPGHWPLRLVPEGWTTRFWRAAACMG
jgi:hypothetical protein